MYEAENGIFQEAKGEMKSIGETQVNLIYCCNYDYKLYSMAFYLQKTIGSLKYEFSNIQLECHLQIKFYLLTKMCIKSAPYLHQRSSDLALNTVLY